MSWVVELTYKSQDGREIVQEFETSIRQRAMDTYNKWSRNPDKFVKLELINVLTDKKDRSRVVRRLELKTSGFVFDDPIPF